MAYPPTPPPTKAAEATETASQADRADRGKTELGCMEPPASSRRDTPTQECTSSSFLIQMGSPCGGGTFTPRAKPGKGRIAHLPEFFTYAFAFLARSNRE